VWWQKSPLPGSETGASRESPRNTQVPGENYGRTQCSGESLKSQDREAGERGIEPRQVNKITQRTTQERI